MRVVEGEHLQVGETVEVEDLLEGADLVAGDVEIGELCQLVQAGLNVLDVVAADPQLLQRFQIVEILESVDLVVAQPQSLQLCEGAQTLNLLDEIVR